MKLLVCRPQSQKPARKLKLNNGHKGRNKEALAGNVIILADRVGATMTILASLFFFQVI